MSSKGSEFKIPVAVSARGGDNQSSPNMLKDEDDDLPDPSWKKKKTQNNNNLTLPSNYTVPPWSGRNDFFTYSFDVVRSGVQLDPIDLSHKDFLMVGKMETNDIELLHQSVSRTHAVIQHKDSGEIYIYDLGSTHGTFVNNNRIPDKKFHELHIGDMIIFGASTRRYFLQGTIPDEQAEEGDIVLDNKVIDLPKKQAPQLDKKTLAQKSVPNSEKSAIGDSAPLKKQKAEKSSSDRKGDQFGRFEDNDNEGEEEMHPDEFQDFTRTREYGDSKDYRVVLEDDEDFFDRSGKNNNNSAGPETFLSLQKKYDQLAQQRISLMLKKQTASKKAEHLQDDDELDQFMNSVNDQLELENEKKIEQIEVEMKRLEELLKILKPL